MTPKNPFLGLAIIILGFRLSSPAADSAPRPARPEGTLQTRWTEKVSRTDPWPEYPRPQMVRAKWQSLNGPWDFAIRPLKEGQPTLWEGTILVPFPVESQLSGVRRWVTSDERLWYRRTFTVPKAWGTQQILLHFGAVDWEATVWVNGQELGTHHGGYDGFSFNVTPALKPGSEQEIIVAVWDPTDAGPQPRGKQVNRPNGIWYTPTTGIWQTAWMEPLPDVHLRSIKITPDVDRKLVRLDVEVSGRSGGETLEFTARAGRRRAAHAEGIPAGESFRLLIPKPKLWSPDSPFLYDLEVRLKRDGLVLDEVQSYFGLRKIALGKDRQGVLRLLLNGQALFQFGPLDQGFWPDGLYTAPTDDALRYDLEVIKDLGFNMVRKHVKVEPERWYYWCDRLGLLVWQDMPNGDKSARWRGPSGYDGEEMKRTPASAAVFEKELQAIIDARYNHPCIVTWVPFNEGWGQFDTVRILNWTTQYDPTRLVDGASGGNHFAAGHILDHHQYPGPGAPKPVEDRALVLGEFGGLGLPVRDHTWQNERNWGYRSFTNSAALTEAYLDLIRKLHPMVRDSNLAGAIYTQTTDVEIEINGLMTYDRALIKMDKEKIAQANRKLYLPPPVARRPSPPPPAAR